MKNQEKMARKKSTGSKILILLLTVLALLGIFMLSLPTLISSQWGQTKLQEYINLRINGSLQFSSIHLSWFGEQSLQGLKMIDDRNRVAAICDEVTSKSPLWRFIKRIPDIGQTKVDRPFLFIEVDRSGRTNLEHIFKQPNPTTQVINSNEPLTAGQISPEILFNKFLIGFLGYIWNRANSSVSEIEYFIGQLEIFDGFLILEKPGFETTHFNNFNGTIKTNDSGRPQFIFLKGEAKQGALSGQILIEGKEEATSDKERPALVVNADINQLPLVGLDQMLFGQNPQLTGLLTAVLGNQLNLHIEGRFSEASSSFQGNINTPMASTKFLGSISDNQLSLSEPLLMRIKLTDSALEFFKKQQIEVPFSLQNPSEVEISLNKLDFPLADNKGVFDYPKLAVQGTLFIPSLKLTYLPENKPLLISEIKGTIENQQNTFPITVDAKLLEESNSGRLALNGQLQFPQRGSGKAIAPFQAKTKLSIAHLSGPDFGNIFLSQQNKKWLALIGPEVNLETNAEYSSDTDQIPFDILLSASNIKLETKAVWEKQAIYLVNPLTADIQVTPDTSRLLLKDFNPLFSGAVGSIEPIKVAVQPQGFFLPVSPFDLSQTTVPQATVYPGKVFFNNGGSLKLLLDLLKLTDIAKLPKIAIWFTPMNCHLAKGIAVFDRTDGLVENSVVISTWGKIDIMNDQVEMILGLPSDTLKKTLGLQKLPNDYVLQIPMTGSTSSLSIDWKLAGARVAKLLIGDANSKPSRFFSKILNFFDKNSDSAETSLPVPPTPAHPWD